MSDLFHMIVLYKVILCIPLIFKWLLVNRMKRQREVILRKRDGERRKMR